MDKHRKKTTRAHSAHLGSNGSPEVQWTPCYNNDCYLYIVWIEVKLLLLLLLLHSKLKSQSAVIVG